MYAWLIPKKLAEVFKHTEYSEISDVTEPLHESEGWIDLLMMGKRNSLA